MKEIMPILQQCPLFDGIAPENLSGGRRAMEDYIKIIETEQAKRREDVDPLLAAREKYLEKKSYGGKTQ